MRRQSGARAAPSGRPDVAARSSFLFPASRVAKHEYDSRCQLPARQPPGRVSAERGAPQSDLHGLRNRTASCASQTPFRKAWQRRRFEAGGEGWRPGSGELMTPERFLRVAGFPTGPKSRSSITGGIHGRVHASRPSAAGFRTAGSGAHPSHHGVGTRRVPRSAVRGGGWGDHDHADREPGTRRARRTPGGRRPRNDREPGTRRRRRTPGGRRPRTRYTPGAENARGPPTRAGGKPVMGKGTPPSPARCCAPGTGAVGSSGRVEN